MLRFALEEHNILCCPVNL